MDLSAVENVCEGILDWGLTIGATTLAKFGETPVSARADVAWETPWLWVLKADENPSIQLLIWVLLTYSSISPSILGVTLFAGVYDAQLFARIFPLKTPNAPSYLKVESAPPASSFSRLFLRRDAISSWVNRLRIFSLLKQDSFSSEASTSPLTEHCCWALRPMSACLLERLYMNGREKQSSNIYFSKVKLSFSQGNFPARVFNARGMSSLGCLFFLR